MRLRLLVPTLVLVLAAPAVPVLGQTDDPARTMGEVVTGSLGELAREIGELAARIDPSDPGAEIDPGSPSEGEDADPGAIDPGDPTDPDGDTPEADDGEGDGGIELPAPSEPEEGGFREIFLVPDPAPKPGRWRVTNKKGTLACTNVGTRVLPATSTTGRITLRDDGKKLTGRSMFDDQTAPVHMTWDPESNQYRGKIRLTTPNGRVNMDFMLRVVDPRKMDGSLTARVNVSEGDISSRCTISRGLALRRVGN